MKGIMRPSLLCVLAFAPALGYADCLPDESLALSCALSGGGHLSLCWTPQQARLTYDKKPDLPAEVRVPLGDVTGLTASDSASSTLRGPGASYEVYVSGQVGGMNQIQDGGGSSSFACTFGTVSGSLAALNDAAIYAPTSKEK
ncbi:hypothetical protein PXK30_22405 [Phaeobacter gallaeciensis]|uniref:hypothetical protein n=2 Tax=Phaeobacter gallaeciensis TaxID=60890 RepID=UPI00237F71A5|nr:hypothetical protein [Phaeobacter gallaeciensis]MDE4205518.1 hypothetical protein [Phaeobacter gallaeciensis]MDE4209591.1 hypothetical protein [Phaeobacter gallaeciensis]MDE4226699.1 hypothetical protein [Phaeobacter gallaeciensis]MDE4229077.1 hypothetical protein [Phaeobacter gallaeciensis]MDE4239222.1 hypothetical protein [Phaeobacter gallaeciensis]